MIAGINSICDHTVGYLRRGYRRLREGESTDAGHRGGVVRSRDEGPVMGPDQRNGAVQLYHTDNPKGEDQRG